MKVIHLSEYGEEPLSRFFHRFLGRKDEEEWWEQMLTTACSYR